MLKISRWWKGRPQERYWLELTRRDDIGTNLKAPQSNEQGKEFWGYSLIKEIEPGDIVYHYDGNKQAFIGRSIAVGRVWEDDILWAARGTSARGAGIEPHVRPGWYLGLEHYKELEIPLTLERIQQPSETSRMKAEANALTEEVKQSVYFPFELKGSRPVRPMQGYLFKLPHAFLEQFGLESEGDDEIPLSPFTAEATVQSNEKLAPRKKPRPASQLPAGTKYRPADEKGSLAKKDPFFVDPSIVERGVKGHAKTQNLLAHRLESHGLVPLSPRADDPYFDLAWRSDGILFVAEVKSLTVKNEEKQLRLALGQVLRYADQLGGAKSVQAVIVAEREPTDSSWKALCDKLGVLLTWPEAFDDSLLKANKMP